MPVLPSLAGIKISNVILSRSSNLIGQLNYLVLSIPLSSVLDSDTQITITLPPMVAYLDNNTVLACQ